MKRFCFLFGNEQDYGCLRPSGKKEFLRHILEVRQELMVNITKVPKANIPVIAIRRVVTTERHVQTHLSIPLYHHLLFFPSGGSLTPILFAIYEGINIFNSFNVVLS